MFSPSIEQSVRKIMNGKRLEHTFAANTGILNERKVFENAQVEPYARSRCLARIDWISWWWCSEMNDSVDSVCSYALSGFELAKLESIFRRMHLLLLSCAFSFILLLFFRSFLTCASFRIYLSPRRLVHLHTMCAFVLHVILVYFLFICISINFTFSEIHPQFTCTHIYTMWTAYIYMIDLIDR